MAAIDGKRVSTKTSGSAGWPTEEKRLTASFHYRTAPDPEAACRVDQR